MRTRPARPFRRAPSLLLSRVGEPRRAAPSEFQIQSAFFQWWRSYASLHGIPAHLCFSVPNGTFLAGDVKRRAIQMSRLKASGLTPGVPDVILLIPSAGFHGLLLEFKAKGGRPSPEQSNFLFDVRRRGYNALLVDTVEEAMQAVRAYVEPRVQP